MASHQRWTKEEAEELQRVYNKMDNDALVEHFDRTFLSIYKKARRLGLYRSKEISFINRTKGLTGSDSPNWKGGRKKTNKGYIYKMDKEHTRATSEGYVLEHIVIMEEHLGRRIRLDEAVHHINGDKSDNRVENLEVMGHGEHTKMHHLGMKRSKKARDRMSKAAIERHKNKKGVL